MDRQPVKLLNEILVSKAELLNHALVAARIVGLQIIEQAAAFANQHEQSATRPVVFLMGLEMFGKVADAFAQKGNLHFRAAGIIGVGRVLINQGLLFFSS